MSRTIFLLTVLAVVFAAFSKALPTIVPGDEVTPAITSDLINAINVRKKLIKNNNSKLFLLF